MSSRFLLSAAAAALTALVVSTPAWSAPLTSRDRQEITQTLNGFVDHLILRKQPVDAWNLVTPAMRAGSTKAQWRHGNVPALAYPAGGPNRRGWTIVYVDPGRVGVDLIVKPKPKLDRTVGPIIFNVDLKRLRGRWLVDVATPGAFLGPLKGKASVFAAPDAGPAPGSESSLKVERSTAHISSNVGLILLLSFGGALVLVPLTVWGVSHARDRAAEARYGSAPRELPPLPTSRRERS